MAVAFALGAISLATAGPAVAQAPGLLLDLPEDQVTPGGGAAELDHPRGVAADVGTGRLFIADRRNSRVSEYTAWGLFVRAWGWNVAPDGAPGDTPADQFEICGPAQPEGSPDPALCQQGAFGEGRGQFALLAGGAAVDGAGNVWIGDLENHRIQKFSSTGQLLLMAGGEVNKTKVEAGGATEEEENVCPFDPGDVCQAGTSGAGPSHLPNALSDVIAYNASLDAILVGDNDRIQIFNLDGSYQGEIPFEGALEEFAGKAVRSLDVGPGGNVYLALTGEEDVFKLSPAGAPLAPGQPGSSAFDVSAPTEVTVDADGNVYASEAGFVNGRYVLGYEPDGTAIEGMEATDEFGGETPITGLATNECSGSDGPNRYLSHFTESFGSRSYVSAYGPGPIGCEPPPQRAPVISEQYATAVGREHATVRAAINPKFWNDTVYFVEYGTGKCSEGGCGTLAPLSPALLTNEVVNLPIATAGVVLEGLEPDTTYNYRFVAHSGGGGPVHGIDPDGEGGPLEPNPEHGREGSFRTFRAATAIAPCSNDGVRVGPAASLSDCRGYEMVSPLDKDSADVATWIGRNNVLPHYLELDQSATSGDRFTYTSAAAFDEPESAPFASQHLANRTGGGWESESISPLRTEPPLNGSDLLLRSEFRGFSANLCSAWLLHNSVAPLDPEAITGFANLYRRENCAKPFAYEAITNVSPPNRASNQYDPTLRGFSADGAHTIFSADDKLHPDAPVPKAGNQLIYERDPEGIRPVCYLPNGNPSPPPCAAGMSIAGPDSSSRQNAISADGSRIFFTTYSISPLKTAQPGRIYVRVDGEETVALSGPLSTDPAFFWTAADDGSRVIFGFAEGSFKDHLYEVDVDEAIAGEPGAATEVAKGIIGPLGASEDASRVYFASNEDLDGGGPASAGNRNLYLHDADLSGGENIGFVMELAAADTFGATSPNTVGEPPLRTIGVSPAARAARVSPDGRHALFMSTVSPTPTGYDNTDAFSGQPDAEVYLYDAVEDQLRCVSCNPTGARPSGANIGPFWGAARIQGWETLSHAPQVLSDDGTRVYFESHEALVPRDTNGTWDVYQWEEPGKGSCTEADATFSPTSGGCVDLISSGQSPAVSTFLDADPSGDNVFFGTQSSLVGADYGLNDVYDARVGGGFPEPDPPSDCVEGGCQSPPPPPPDVTPASESTRGQGNATAARKVCPKGKRRVVRKGKSRCVKKRRARRQRTRGNGGRR